MYEPNNLYGVESRNREKQDRQDLSVYYQFLEEFKEK